MKSAYEKLKSLFLPIVAISAIAGIFQDLFLPLAKFGIKVGVAFIVVGTLFIFVQEKSRLSEKIKEITDNWKYPIIFSLYLIGILIITCAVYTQQSGKKNGILASKFPALETIQKSLLGIDEKITSIKSTVEENNKTTNEIKNDTDILIKNTTKNAYQELSARGLQPNNHYDFIKSVKDSNWAEFTELMTIYEKANFNLLKELQMPEPVLEHGYLSDQDKAQSFFTPSKTNVISALILLKTDFKKVKFITNLFDLEIKELISPISNGYARSKYANLPFDQMLSLITHPQINVATGEDINLSLISHQLKRNENITEKRGRYNLLHYVAVMGYKEYLGPLLAEGVDINGTSYTGYTPLALAVEVGNIDMAELLLKHGADFKKANTVSIEIALIKALNPYESKKGIVTYYSLYENPYIKFLISHGISKYPIAIQATVENIYAKYIDDAVKTYGSQNEKVRIYKTYLKWLKEQASY
ncbi:ankyrin repeat domain-containing protein [Pseudoalteromonas sp. MIP2626]|uniref:ankyrin repeat domain-containing protein n=1 Tax=Pseudoalteromonas sp. MIP2626 TaxID=2705464 RepID=UPI0015C9B544|nr:ankyrin repeat domain-containing protein [Pseudoalteromonas sp. MIP2626]NYR13901.1 ankyrin repeat domain-containing protein [Pseudoalteromonas sp. MIP2626]